MAVALLTRLTNPIASPSNMATRRSMVAWKVLSPTFWSCTPSSTTHTIQTCIICEEVNIWNQAAAGAEEEEEEEPTCSEPGGAKHLTGVQLRVMKSYIGKIKKKKIWSSFDLPSCVPNWTYKNKNCEHFRTHVQQSAARGSPCSSWTPQWWVPARHRWPLTPTGNRLAPGLWRWCPRAA